MGNLTRLLAYVAFLIVAGGIYAGGIMLTESTLDEDKRDDARLMAHRDAAIVNCDDAQCRMMAIDYYDYKARNNNMALVALIMFNIIGGIIFIGSAIAWGNSVYEDWD